VPAPVRPSILGSGRAGFSELRRLSLRSPVARSPRCLRARGIEEKEFRVGQLLRIELRSVFPLIPGPSPALGRREPKGASVVVE
jgi:hypothetical protein